MSQYHLTSDQGISVELKSDELQSVDLVKRGDGQYHIISDYASMDAQVHHIDLDNKTVTLTVDDVQYTFAIEDQYDALVKQMGLSVVSSQKVGAVKAPMPGLILEILVSEGQEIKEGDDLLILEAMKMENVLKAAGDGTIKSIEASKGDAVEKGQLLIEME